LTGAVAVSSPRATESEMKKSRPSESIAGRIAKTSSTTMTNLTLLVAEMAPARRFPCSSPVLPALLDYP
jgi:hypothetical protein